MLSKIRTKLLKSEFSRNVSSQILGTGLAQLLPFLATPLLTRLFTEEDFASYTSFFALAAILQVAAGGKYQPAIILPKTDSKALRIFTLSIYLTLFYALVLILFFFLFYEKLQSEIGYLIYFIPVHVVSFGIWNAFTHLSIRNKQFNHNAIAKVLQSIFYIGTSVLLGLVNFNLYGLIVGKIMGTLASWVFLFKKSNVKARLVKFIKLKHVAKEYSDYPRYGILPAFLNTISAQSLILILTKFYTTDDLGYFGLTFMVLSAPLGLIGTSFKDVFFQKIAFLSKNEQFKEAYTFFKKSALLLFLLGLPICAILYFFGTDIFSIAFGKKWIRSGEFASVLAFSFLVKLVVSPLSSIFNATNTLKIASRWQVFYFFTTFVTLGYCGAILKLDVLELLYIYVVHEIVLYSVYLWLQRRTLKKYIKNVQAF